MRSFGCCFHYRRRDSYILDASQQAARVRVWHSRREQRIDCGVLETFIGAIKPRL